MTSPIYALPLYPVFHDLTGAPLEAGYIWIGQAGTNAQASPVQVYWDADLTIPITQPIRTLAGYPSRNGSPGAIYVTGDYSITVRDKNSVVVYSALNGVNFADAVLEIAAAAVSSVDWMFDTVAAMVASTDLIVGAKVRTRGYFAVGDGGGNDYTIVAAGTGTVDGGRYINVTGSSVQARGEFPANVVDVRKFGVPASGDASAVFTAANAYALDARGADTSVQLVFRGTAEISNPISLGGETAFAIDFAGSQINVIAGGALTASPSQAAITIRCPQSIVFLGTLDCNLICGGYRISDSANTKFHFGRTLQFIWRGVTADVADGVCAGAIFFGFTGTERSASDSYTTRTAVGIYNNCNDVRWVSAHVGYCLYPIWNGPDGNGATFIECHPFNGSPNEVGGAQHSFTMVNECPVRAWCYNCYFDNGYIDDRTATLSISDSWNVQLNSTLTDPIFRVKMPADPADIRGGADNIAFSMGYYTGTWSGPSPTLVSMNYDPAEMTDRGSRRIQYSTQETRVIPDHGTTIADFHVVKQNATPIRWQFSSTGSRTRVVWFQNQMRLGNSSGIGGWLALNASGDGAWIREDEVNKSLILGSDNADRVILSAAGVLRPYTTDGTQNIGSSSNRWGTVYAAVGTINTSDRREKRDIAAINDAVLDAWSEVNFAQFRWENPDIYGDKVHFGVIAQDIEDAFARHGLNALDYGLLTHDEWVEADGTARDRYGVRMDQCLVLEMACLRRERKG